MVGKEDNTNIAATADDTTTITGTTITNASLRNEIKELQKHLTETTKQHEIEKSNLIEIHKKEKKELTATADDAAAAITCIYEVNL